jgi:hypothetical protein
MVQLPNYKDIKKMVTCLVLLFAFTSFVVAQERATTDDISNSSPMLLKLNNIYLFYSNPIAPFIKDKGRVMIPARVLSELLGLHVSYEPDLSSVTLSHSGSTLIFTANSNAAYQNDRSVVLDTTPVLYEKDILIPIRPLLETFNFAFAWNDETRLLIINNPRIVQGGDITLTFNDRIFNIYKDTNNFIPSNIKLEGFSRDSSLPDNTAEISLQLHELVPTNQRPELFLMAKVIGDGPVIIGGPDTYISADTGERNPSLCKEITNVVICQITFDSLFQPVDYIIGRVGVLSE